MTAKLATDRSVAAISALDSLPTLPVVALRIGELVHARNTSVAQLAEVLAGDPSLSAKLLRLVNSPYFGIPGGVSDVARAIPFVGFNTLYQLVLSISVLETLTPASTGFDPRALWLHSLTVATGARVIAQDIPGADADACFTAGLLHDIGKIALAMIEPKKLAASFEEMQRTGIAATQAEMNHGLPAHDVAGSRLAKQWRFPTNLALPIEHHHAIHKAGIRDRMTPGIRTITEIVACADELAHRCANTVGVDEAIEDGDAAAAAALFEHLGLSTTTLDDFYSRTMKKLEASKVFLTLLEKK